MVEEGTANGVRKRDCPKIGLSPFERMVEQGKPQMGYGRVCLKIGLSPFERMVEQHGVRKVSVSTQDLALSKGRLNPSGRMVEEGKL